MRRLRSFRLFLLTLSFLGAGLPMLHAAAAVRGLAAKKPFS